MKAALTSTVHQQKNPFSNCRTHNDVRRSAWSLTGNKVQSYGLVSCRLFQIESTQSLGIVTISRQRSYPSLLKWEPVLRALLRNILYKSRTQSDLSNNIWLSRIKWTSSFKELVMIPVITWRPGNSFFQSLFLIECLIPLSGVRELYPLA